MRLRGVMTSFFLAAVIGGCAASPKPDEHGFTDTDSGRWKISCNHDICIVILDETENGDSTVYVVLDRHTKKPRNFGFNIAEAADKDKGIVVQFVPTLIDTKRPECAGGADALRPVDCYSFDVSEKNAFNGPFDSCDQQSCLARVQGQFVGDEGSPSRLDLLDHFMHDYFLFMIYADTSGQLHKLKLSLSGFDTAYADAMKKL